MTAPPDQLPPAATPTADVPPESLPRPHDAPRDPGPLPSIIPDPLPVSPAAAVDASAELHQAAHRARATLSEADLTRFLRLRRNT